MDKNKEFVDKKQTSQYIENSANFCNAYMQIQVTFPNRINHKLTVIETCLTTLE